MRDQKKSRSILSRADGVVIPFQHIVFVIDHHPVRSIKGRFATCFYCRGHPSSKRRGMFREPKMSWAATPKPLATF
jgi:hypothetical protein